MKVERVRIADGVDAVVLGRGPLSTNVYLVRWAASWVLVDTGWPGHGPAIRRAAEEALGAAAPRAILLTHIHPDHAGSVRELAEGWGAPVFVHPAELPLAAGYVPEYANPLDQRLVMPVLGRLPRTWRERMQSGSDLTDVVRPLDPEASPPGLPDWVTVHAPGHTPGSVAFFRPRDRLLISGDALLTVDLTSLGGLLAGRTRLASPLRFTDWDRAATEETIAALSRLRPAKIAPGHGRPMAGAAVAPGLRELTGRLHRRAAARRLEPSSAAVPVARQAPATDT